VRGADPEWHKFVRFVRQYGRAYTSVREVNAKFDIFRDNMKIAAGHQARNPKATFGVTKFSDISTEEFRRNYLLSPESAAELNALAAKNRHHHGHKKNATARASPQDWCESSSSQGSSICTPIKDQAQCGSCWAFSTMETLETVVAQAGKPLVALSPQELVDCDTNDQGCNGGLPSNAVNWLVGNGGADTEESYPYTGTGGACSRGTASAMPSGYQSVSGGDSGLQDAIGTGVVSVGVDASSWQNYQGGILSDCGTQLDHAVVAAGWQTGYYIVRNSWGGNWGMNGYIQIQDSGDICGIADTAITIQL